MTWKVAVPGGSSSPCIWDDRVYVTGYADDRLVTLCCSRADGSEIWRHEAELAGEEVFGHPHASPAMPSPCTDGERVFVYFGAYGLIALDADDGSVRWEKRFPIERNGFGTGTSPILDGDSLYMLRDVAGLSTLTCYDPATGSERWVTPRPESQANYSSPFVWRREDRTEIVVPSTSALKSYDASTGEEIWRVTGTTVLACTSPTADDDILYYGAWSTGNAPAENRLATGFDDPDAVPAEVVADPAKFVAYLDENGDGVIRKEEIPPSRIRDAFEFLDFDRNGDWTLQEIQGFVNFEPGPGKNILIAVQGGGEGDITDTHVLWEKDKGIPYVASPLLYRGRLYYVKKGGFLSCIDAATGEAHYERVRLRVGGEYYATPLAIGDHVLVCAERGTMFVIEAGDEFEISRRIEFGESLAATPFAVDGTLYVRTSETLYAFDTPES